MVGRVYFLFIFIASLFLQLALWSGDGFAQSRAKYDNRPKANEVEFLDSDESSRDDLAIKAEIEKDQDQYYADLDKNKHSFDEVKDLAARRQQQQQKEQVAVAQGGDEADVDRMVDFHQKRAQALRGVAAAVKQPLAPEQPSSSGQLQAVLQQFGIGGVPEGDGTQAAAQQELVKKLLNDKGALEAMLRQMVAPFQGMSDEQARQLIVDHMKNTWGQGLFDYFPWLYQLFGRMLKDPDAFPKMSGIMTDRNRLYLFAALTFLTFLVSFFIKRKVKKIEERKLFSRKRFKYLLLLSLAFWSTRIYLVVHFFGPELAPAWRILVDTAPYLSFLK